MYSYSGIVSIEHTLRRGNEVVISRGSSQDACPVSIFKRYVSELERFPVEPSHYDLSLELNPS